MNHEDLTLKESLYKALHAYNNSINQTTKYTPFELFFGRKQDEDLEILDIANIKEKKIILQSDAYNNSLRNKKNYIEKRNEKRTEAENLPIDIDVYVRTTPVNKLQQRNKKLSIQRQKKLNAYDKNDLKYHKNKINKPRKILSQGLSMEPGRNPGPSRQSRNSNDTNEGSSSD